MKLRFHKQYLFFISTFYLLVSASQPAGSQSKSLLFEHLTVEDGLSNGIVHEIYQDKMGFMWFGTDMGLNKYDGHKFTVYQHITEDTLSIASNFVVDMLEDSYGSFWIGNGYSGLNLFDGEKEIFLKYSSDPDIAGSISSNNIRTVFEDSRKNLWIGTAGGGLNLYNRESDSFFYYQHDTLNQSGIGSNFINSIAEDKNGYLWIGSQEGILTRFDAKTGIGHSFKLYDHYMDLYHIGYAKVLVDLENNVWFGTENGLYFYDQVKNTFQHFVEGNTNRHLTSNSVSSLLEVGKEEIFVAIDHGGLNVYDKSTGTFTYYNHSDLSQASLSNDQLGPMYISRDGTIWIASFSNGVNILSEYSNKFLQYKDLVDPVESMNSRNSVLTICEDKDKNIWIGTDGMGIDIIHPKTYKVKNIVAEKGNLNSIQGDVVTEIFRDRNDDLWIGTYLEGMSRLNWKTKQYTHYRHNAKNSNSLCGNNVWTILEDKKGFLWIGTMGNGMDRFDRKTNTFKHFRSDPDDSTSLSNNDVFKIIEDHTGQIWAGTRNGLCRLNEKTGMFTRFMSGTNIKNGLFGGWIYDIYQDRLGNLWIG
ncbi:MAG: hypothetical protein JW830_11585, partial [Bacteroidales bacterium]|nr:hypothetical protein [Bacteroidales bacterium]